MFAMLYQDFVGITGLLQTKLTEHIEEDCYKDDDPNMERNAMVIRNNTYMEAFVTGPIVTFPSHNA